MHIFKNTSFDFLRWRWQAIAVSWVFILAGVFAILTKGIPLGVEFAGGTVVIEQFDQAVSVEQVRSALDRNYPAGGQNSVVQAYGDPSQRQVMIRVPQVGAESGASLSTIATEVEQALKKGNLGGFRRQGAEIVSATVGRELETKGIYATVLSLIGLLIYLGFRFQLSFGVGAVVATIHDLLITLAFLAFFRYDMSLNVIAAILTITGFSTNDTIVIFDRIRENLRTMRRDNLNNIINVVDQPDPRADGDHLGHRAPDGARALLLRRRGAPRLRLHDDRRHHHRHLLQRVHRGGDRELLAGQGAGPGGRPRAGGRRAGGGRGAAGRTPVEERGKRALPSPSFVA